MGIEEKREHTAHTPETLDLVMIDNRWAQVFSGTRDCTIKWLDDGKMERIDLGRYVLAQHIGYSIYNVNSYNLGPRVPESIVSKVHWGPEQEAYPNLRSHVTFFGVFRKKE